MILIFFTLKMENHLKWLLIYESVDKKSNSAIYSTIE